MNTVRGFREGFEHVIRGSAFLKANPKLWKWTLAPLLIAIVVVFSGLGYGYTLISDWVTMALQSMGLDGPGAVAVFLSYLIGFILWVVYLILVIYGTFLITTIVAAPFNSLLAERTLMLVGTLEERPFQFKRWLVVSVRMLCLGILKSLVFLMLGLLIFICSFIPGLNVLSSYLAFMIMAFDSMDYSFEIAEMSLVQRFRYFRKSFTMFAGMGGFLGLTLFVPGATLLILPLSVIGSALAFRPPEKGMV